MLKQLRTQVDPGQPRLGRTERRRQAPADQPDEPERSRLRLVGLRPDGALLAAVRDQAVFSIIGTPPWANGAAGVNVAPDTDARPRAVRHRCRAPLRRHVRAPPTGGSCRPCAAGSPGTSRTTRPSSGRSTGRCGGKVVIQSAIDYAKICNAVVKGVRKTTIGASKVACGVTGPRGNNNPNSDRPAVSPLPFLRAMKKAGAKGFDAYAHHPYYGAPRETPSTPPPPGIHGNAATAVTLGNFKLLITRGDAAVRQQADLDHRVRLPDEPARPDLRRLPRQAGQVPDAGLRDREEASPHRHVHLVPAPRRGAGLRGLAVRPSDRRPARRSRRSPRSRSCAGSPGRRPL